MSVALELLELLNINKKISPTLMSLTKISLTKNVPSLKIQADTSTYPCLPWGTISENPNEQIKKSLNVLILGLKMTNITHLEY